MDSSTVDEETLVERFRGRLLTLALRRMGDLATAEDVAQDTLARVVEALQAGRVESLEALPAFVYQTARHVCLQRRRSFGRQGRAYRRLASERGAIAVESAGLTRLIDGERRAVVRAALDQLGQQDRELLRMLYFEDLEMGTVAVRLGLRPGALRVRKHRALRRLSAVLEDLDSAVEGVDLPLEGS